MASSTDFFARGKIIEVRDSIVVFQPASTNYQMHLAFSGDVPATVSTGPIDVLIRVDARKVYTVPSGGNFISPIFGPPKIIQGRVRYADEKTVVVHGGVPIIISLPAADTAIDLSQGRIQVGHTANVVALPGARLEMAQVAAVV